VLRTDGVELLGRDADMRRLSEQSRTLAELLEGTEGWQPPAVDVSAVAQPHCHQHAVLGFDADRHLLERSGVSLTTVEGCCGLAGNFGYEKGHLDV
jgi:Fe-S oxidoreductase